MSLLTKPVIKFQKNHGLSDEELLKMYKAIVLPRLIEEKMLSQLRLGKVSKWFQQFWARSYFCWSGFGNE
jgi:2-oxoisovalerate dehydrogenase E1 component